MDSHSGNAMPEANNNTQLQQDIRAMIFSLTKHLTTLNKSAAARPNATTRRYPSSEAEDDDDQGLKIITLAGANKGAVVRAADWDEVAKGETHGMALGDDEKMFSYVNGNYQALNNSIMLGGSYTAKDPGVFLDLSDYVDDDDDDEEEKEREKKEKQKMEEEEGGGTRPKTEQRFNGFGKSTEPEK